MSTPSGYNFFKFRLAIAAVLLIPSAIVALALMFGFRETGKEAWGDFIWELGFPIAGYCYAVFKVGRKSARTISRGQGRLFFGLILFLSASILFGEIYLLFFATTPKSMQVEGLKPWVENVRYSPTDANRVVCDYLVPWLVMVLIMEVSTTSLDVQTKAK